MKFTWKIAIALAAVLCLTAVLMACNDEADFVYVTDEAGEVVTDAAGEPVTEPDLDGDGVGDGTTDPSPESTSDSEVTLEEKNEESGWSELFKP